MREEICLLISKATMNNITKTTLAKTMGISPQYLSEVLHGREKPAKNFTERMQKALDELTKPTGATDDTR